MTQVAYLLGVLLFAAGLLGSVALHEAGHLIPGKLFNVKVTQFFVGFGRTIWSRRRGETEYGLKAIPLGGYCKLVGMVEPRAEEGGPDAEVDRVRSRSTGMFAQLVDDARDAEYEHVGPEDHDRLFYRKPWWQQVVIMGSGVAINLVLAFVLFAIALMGYGTYRATTTVQSVSACVIAVTEANQNQAQRCTADDPESPAKLAGFRAGDRVLSVNGVAMTTWSKLQRAISDNGDRVATVVVERDGERVTLKPRAVVTTRSVVSGDSSKITKAGFLGITPGQEREREGVGAVFSTMGEGTWGTIKIIGTMPDKVYHVGRAILGLEERDPAGPMSIVGGGRVAGEVASTDRIPVWDRFFSLVAMLGSLNLFLGLVNLVPLPPFDGGGIATTIYGAIRRRIARLLGRPDPGPVDSAKLLPLTYAMTVVILLLSVILIVGDVVAPVQLG